MTPRPLRFTPFLSRGLLSATLLAAGAFAHAANEPHFPTSEELRHLKAIGGPQPSPDGKQVLFNLTDATADGAKTHIWLVATAGGTARQLTFSPPADKRGERNAQWSVDGGAILFVAHRGEHTQLFRLDLRGGEAAPYDLKVMPAVDVSKERNAIPPAGAEKPASTDNKDGDKLADKAADRTDAKKAEGTVEPIEIDVAGYALSADGKYMAVWADDPETPGEKKQKDAKADANWVNHKQHGTRLYLATLKPDGMIDGPLKLVGVAPDVKNATWAPASDRLLVITEKPNEASDLGPAGAMFVVDAASPAKATKLDAIPATVGAAAWSNEGNEIVFAAATPEDAPPGYHELYALSLAGGDAKPVQLTAGFHGQINAGALYFPPDGWLIAQAAVGTRATVVKVALDGKTGPATVDLGASVITGLNTNRKQTGWVWLAESGGQPVKLCFAAHLGEACTTLAIPELAPAQLRSVAPQLVHWQSGGMTIEGLLYLPTLNGSVKAPLVVDVHGGPFGAWEDRNDPFAAFMVGHGWAILRPNPRGSSNYGVKFAAANKNDLGGGDYQDVMAGVDAVLAKFPVDATRMALMGYSYGGEMAGFAEGKTDRFKAIISGAPVIDQFSEYGTESRSWYDRWYFGKPWEHMQDAWRQSPLASAGKAKAPFLLLQGESDTTDPLGQAQEMYRALRQEGVPVELVTYPRENHGPLAVGMFGRSSPEPWHGFDGRQRIVEFLNKAFGEAAEKQ